MDKKEVRYKGLIEENNDKILRICRYYAPSADDQKDMYQEILINIWKSLDNFRGESAIGTWIYRISINTSLSFAGKYYKQMKMNINIESLKSGNIITDNDYDDENDEGLLGRFQIELNQLSVIDKALIGLVSEGLSTKEIAEIIGITEPNVRVKIHRIKEMLHVKLKGGKNEN